MKKEKLNMFGNIKSYKNWYKNLTTIDKRILFSFLGAIVVLSLFIIEINLIRDFNSDLTQQECNQLRTDDVRYFLGLREENRWLAFIYAFQLPFKMLVIAIAIGWILHGVGFRII